MKRSLQEQVWRGTAHRDTELKKGRKRQRISASHKSDLLERVLSGDYAETRGKGTNGTDRTRRLALADEVSNREKEHDQHHDEQRHFDESAAAARLKERRPGASAFSANLFRVRRWRLFPERVPAFAAAITFQPLYLVNKRERRVAFR